MARAGDPTVGWLDGDRTVVWLDGDHDITTVFVLTGAPARAIPVDDADLIRPL